MALYIAWGNYEERSFGLFNKRRYLDATAALLELAFQLSSEPGTADREQSWVIVKAFLWTSWQRALMVCFWDLGYGITNSRSLAVRGVTSFPELFAQRTLQQSEDRKNAPYLCSWAYELLRTDRACIAMDFRRFHQCYGGLFGDRPARCNDGQQQCDGRSPENCQRFKGATVLDQSAHDWKCQMDCKRLYWDKVSFLNVSGAKAVCLDSTDDRQLRYCEASNKTLAISHVWSHGQGGRPDTTGFNACLHHRYADLAIFFNCDSYWMDTPCIPSEKKLRAECIDNINKIFTESKVTLVCDRDIMTIDISNLTIRLRESLLATVLVCDWNIRAWTLLEAMRGRHNIHLLCKRNEVICVQETLKAVHEEGRIDLAILFLTTQHLKPLPPPGDWELFPGMGSVATDEDRMMEMGFVSVGEAGSLLSHRHASRDEDDIVIWSLLVNEKAIKNAAQIWKGQLGAKINTGFLLSSTPRIQGYKGLSWAPCSPTLRLPPDAGSRVRLMVGKMGSTREKVYLAYEGADTRSGVITSEGLQAKWLVHIFPTSPADHVASCPADGAACLRGIVKITSRYLQNYSWGALLRPCASPGPPYIPAQYRGNAQGPLLATCGSNDERCWEWSGVYEWLISDPLPEFRVEDILLV